MESVLAISGLLAAFGVGAVAVGYVRQTVGGSSSGSLAADAAKTLVRTGGSSSPTNSTGTIPGLAKGAAGQLTGATTRASSGTSSIPAGYHVAPAPTTPSTPAGYHAAPLPDSTDEGVLH